MRLKECKIALEILGPEYKKMTFDLEPNCLFREFKDFDIELGHYKKNYIIYVWYKGGAYGIENVTSEYLLSITNDLATSDDIKKTINYYQAKFNNHGRISQWE